MRLLTEDAVLICDHGARVEFGIKQDLVTIGRRRLLVEGDPEAKPIRGCPNAGPTIKPCTRTLAVHVGYSDLIRVRQRRVCLDHLTGLTDGTPPGTVIYRVQRPGQELASEGQ